MYTNENFKSKGGSRNETNTDNNYEILAKLA
ncbi:hypothetical protein FNP_0353 [Fusobacterium polymorphum ATCC 10953]|uniref:Uncharacterized protein n=1 Tax=Fusobacterium polymorphum ATCC 10953 TaxID=393480 RepID=A5TTE2_FUSNP|nr:hypothetical protein FNP_0353 [Fusobacterium polymorphum ATCC 10953]